jgi:modulator of FtsH protease
MMNPMTVKPQSSSAALPQDAEFVRPAQSAVLRNTYWLLGLTLLFSGATAMATAALGLPHPGLLLTLAGYFGLLFLTARLRNSAWGLVSVFALTGFMGYTLGPVINAYLAMSNGPALVATAMGITGVAFFGLSAYARVTRAVNMLKFGTFLFVGILTAFILGLVSIFFTMPALGLAVSGLFVLLMCGLIVYETQNIINGGETNYIMATVTLFVAVFNLFSSLLHLLGFFGGEDG